MRNIIFIIILLTLKIQNVQAEIQECPMHDDEILVCEAVLCVIGIFIPESRSKCLQVNRKFAIYLATLGFWSDPPSCKKRDINCNVTGEATADVDLNICDSLDNESDINACNAALGNANQEYCDTFTGEEKEECEANIPQRME